MPRPSIKWVTTDTHFYHNAMFEHGLRPRGFEWEILKWWKHYIRPYDTMIHLGDVIFYNYTSLKAILDSVPCRKVLTLGNHDRKSASWYMRNGFDWAGEGFMDRGVYFSHHPTGLGEVNVHGHLHLRKPNPDPRYFLVSLERLRYKPLNLNHVPRPRPSLPVDDVVPLAER